MQRATMVRPLAEITAMSALLASYIWGWQGAFEGAFTLCVILYGVIGLATHILAREGPVTLGLRMDNLRSAGRDALLATIPIGFLLVGSGALLGSLNFQSLDVWPRALMDGIAWGTLQQYGLLCIYYRRFTELLPRHRCDPMWASGAVFALLHFPNPFLMATTFGAGVLSCWLYRRTPNLIVLGVMHGVISFMISGALPTGITMGMRVGPGFAHFVGRR